MKIELTQRNINRDAYDSTHQYIKELAERHLQPHVLAFKASERRLHATVEHEKVNYRVVMRLHLPPKKVLVAHASDENVRSAIQKAIEELSRQAERHHAHISGRERWKRKQRRQKLRQLEAEVGEIMASAPEQPETALSALLPRLESWLRHEMTYLRANGDLLENYPTVADVRDEIFLAVKARRDEVEHTEEALYAAMLKSASEILAREVANNKLHEDEVSLEQQPPKDAEDQSEEMVGEEFEEFYQPDEVLHIEDLTPMPGSARQELTEEELAISSGYRLMAHMPIRWRRVLTLRYRESLSTRQIAEQVFQTTISDIEATLDKAEQFLVEHLREQGLGDYTDLPRLLNANAG
ncbi:MAG TPA: hypothetical protein ENK26_06275 [Gammaproteobacteria bacterium]|nr:hypothetical protein [Gammaproteobacteria bacterium]